MPTEDPLRDMKHEEPGTSKQYFSSLFPDDDRTAENASKKVPQIKRNSPSNIFHTDFDLLRWDEKIHGDPLTVGSNILPTTYMTVPTEAVKTREIKRCEHNKLTIWTKYKKIQEVREAPISICKKRILKEYLEDQQVKIPHKIIDRVKVYFAKLIRGIATFIDMISPTQTRPSTISRIAGKGGIGVGLIFVILKKLINFNLLMFLYLCITFVIPYQLDIFPENSVNNSECLEKYHGLKFPGDDATFIVKALQFIGGYGSIENGSMLEGYYENKYHMLGAFPVGSYYLTIITTVYIFYLYFIINLGVSLIRRGVFLFSTNRYRFSNLVFAASYDFNLKDQDAVELKQEGWIKLVARHLKKYMISTKSFSPDPRLWIRILAHIIYIVFIIVGIILIKEKGAISIDGIVNRKADIQLQDWINWFVALPSLMLSLSNFQYLVFYYLINFESYTQINRSKILITRALMYRYLLFFGYIKMVLDEALWTPEGEKAECRKSEKISWCWENMVAIQIYVALILETICVTIISFIIDHIRRLLFIIGCPYLPNNVDGGYYIVIIVYLQSALWISLFFFPFNLLITSISLVLFRKFVHLTLPILFITDEIFLPSNFYSIFMLLMALGFVVGSVYFHYTIVYLLPSSCCGPFDGVSRMIMSLLDDESANHTAYLYPKVVGPNVAFLMMIAALYYYKRAKAQEVYNEHLRNQIKIEGTDKKVLHKYVEKLRKKLCFEETSDK